AAGPVAVGRLRRARAADQVTAGHSEADAGLLELRDHLAKLDFAGLLALRNDLVHVRNRLLAMEVREVARDEDQHAARLQILERLARGIHQRIAIQLHTVAGLGGLLEATTCVENNDIQPALLSSAESR